MSTPDIISILAILAGPVLAVQVQKFLERQREHKNKRAEVFKTLMATRGAVLSAYHVEALNRIDLEFSGDKKYKKVIEAWKEYFDNLNNRKKSEEDLKIWGERNEELLANLLYEMGNSLGYTFDKVSIKRNMYSPQGHLNVEREHDLIRMGLFKLLSGEISLSVESTNVLDEESLNKQKELQDLLLKYYKDKEPLNVRITKD